MTEGHPSKPDPDAEVTEASIAVHWKEEAFIDPPASFVAQANLSDPRVLERFTLDRFPEYYREFSDLLTWDAPWSQILDASRAPFYRWFVGGRLNASANCVDRHLGRRGD
ncbi:MAG: hypothetical protein L3J93_04920, partial [Thermoplasmata archaeon]|nr:hypothetical protein [Thermoplasmata archaeon]